MHHTRSLCFLSPYPEEPVGHRWLPLRQAFVIAHTKDETTNPNIVTFDLSAPVLEPVGGRNAATISVNGVVLWTGQFTFPHETHNVVLRLPTFSGGVYDCVIEAERAFVPARHGLGDDERELALVMSSVRLFTADEFENEIEHRLIWVFGAARSGTTWLGVDIMCHGHRNRPIDEIGLGMLLGASAPHYMHGYGFGLPKKSVQVPSIHDSANPQDLGGLGRNLAHYLTDSDLAALALTREDVSSRTPRFEDVRRNGPKTIVKDKGFLYDRMITLDRFRANFVLNKKHWNMSMRHIRRWIVEFIVEEWGYGSYRDIVLKCADDSIAADIFMAVFPRARMIHLVRDARDVVTSRMHISAPFGFKGGRKERRYFLWYHANLWRVINKVIDRAYENTDASYRYRLRYEDLRRSPRDEIKRLHSFLGYSTTEDELSRIVEESSFERLKSADDYKYFRRRKGKTGAFNDELSNREIRSLTKHLCEDLQRYGYEASDGKAGRLRMVDWLMGRDFSKG